MGSKNKAGIKQIDTHNILSKTWCQSPPARKLATAAIICGLSLPILIILLNHGVNFHEIGSVEGAIYIIALILILAAVSSLHIKQLNTWINHLPNFLLRALIWVAIAGATLLLSAILIEAVAQAYVNVNQLNQVYWYTLNSRKGDYDLLLENPAYQDAPYAIQAFVGEIIAVQTPKESDFSTLPYVLPNNFSGTYINVVEYVRKTSFQSDSYINKLYLFGGSTIFNLAVPDKYTVASYLQKMLNQAYDNRYQVINMGVIGATSGQQLQRLQAQDLEAGDIVIFFDGYNDIFKGMSRDSEVLLSWLTKSALFNYFLKPYLTPYLPEFHPPDRETLTGGYATTIIAANDFTHAHQSIFFHFLQPSLHTVSPRSVYESQLIDQLINKAHGWHEGFLVGYPQLRQTNQTLRHNEEIWCYDLTDALNPENRFFEGEIFLDDIHINHLGNQMIAEEIFNILIKKLPDNPQNQD